MTGDVLGDDGDIANITGLTGEDLMMQLGPQQVRLPWFTSHMNHVC